MGRDKALLRIDGDTLVELALGKLRSLGLDPRICGSRPDLAQFAGVVEDHFAQAGPLAGLEAALAHSDSDLNLFVPVDLPDVPEEFLRWLMTRAERTRAVATIPRYGDRDQPLCAVYSRRLLQGLRKALAAGDHKVMVAIGESAAALGERIDRFDVECVAASGALDCALGTETAGWFHNVNTPADYETLEQAAGAKSRHPIS